MTKTTNKYVYGFIFIALLIIDQSTKYFFSHTSVMNTGISFSFFSESGWILSTFLFAMWLLGWWVTRQWFQFPWWSHAAFWGAAAANILDRVVWGGVRDIWLIPGTAITNNFADWVIALIAVYWMWYLYQQEKHGKRNRTV